jgi:hypothetical protein
MMDCQRVKQLLPLWVGQDLPDVSMATEVTRHLENCRVCEQLRKNLQVSLDVLQGSSSETLLSVPRHSSVWPKLAVRISEWDNRRNRDQFRDWLPASVMALAVTVMIAVSIPSMLQEFYADDSTDYRGNLFGSDDTMQAFRDHAENSPSNPLLVHTGAKARPGKVKTNY